MTEMIEYICFSVLNVRRQLPSVMSSLPVVIKKAVLISGVLAGVVAILFGWQAVSPGRFSGPVESLTLAYVPTEAAALVFIAEDRGFFADNGVKLVLKPYSTGVETLQALANGEVDIAGTAEFSFIARVFGKEKLSIYAIVDRFQNNYLVGRKDQGIETVADLRGKRIGLPRGSIVEFYLGRFLQMNGLSLRDVTLVGIAPTASQEALETGAVDGVVVWNPFAYQMRQRMADKATFLPLQGNQPSYAVAVARNDWLAEHKGVINRSLEATAQAEQYLIAHPQEAKSILQKRMNVDGAFVEAVWPENQFSLSLHQSLIVALEDEARWMIANQLTNEKRVPDFMDYIYIEGLKQVRPATVNILR